MSDNELERQAYEQKILEQEEIINQLMEQLNSYQHLLCFGIHQLGGMMIVSQAQIDVMPKVGNIITRVDKVTGAVMVTYDQETIVDMGPTSNTDSTGCAGDEGK